MAPIGSRPARVMAWRIIIFPNRSTRNVSIALFISLLWAQPAGIDAAELDLPLRIRVLSYNIHHGEGVDGVLDLGRIARVIQSVSPDLVALQEVDRRMERTGRVNQPKELARLTGMEVLFGTNLTQQGGEYGNAVLSKLPIVKHRNIHLPTIGNGEQRGLLLIELAEKGTALLFLGTHLDARRDDRERRASAETINAVVLEYDPTPAILAGDLNATPTSPVLDIFGEHWRRSNPSELKTVPVAEPQRQIDFILVRPERRWKVVETRVLEEAVASDHRAVFAVLELRSE